MAAAKRNIGLETRSYIKGSHVLYLGFVLLMVVSALLLTLPSPYYLIPFALVAGVVFVVGTIKYPFFGLFGYLIIFFLNPNDLFPLVRVIPIPYEKIIAILVISSLLINIAVIRKQFDVFHLDYALFAFVGAAFVSILGAIDLQTAWDLFVKFFKVCLIYLLIARIVVSSGKFKAVIILYVLSIGFLAISSAIDYYSGNLEVRQGIQRLHSFGGGVIDPNSLATSLILAMPFMFFMVRAHKNLLLKIFMLLLLASCVWTVILTGSRGGMIGIVAVMSLLAWYSRYRLRAFAVAVAALLIFAAAMPEQYQDRFMTIFAVGQEDENGAGESAYGRINGLILGFKFLLKNPVTGVGIGNFGRHHYMTPGGDWTDAHNLVGKLVGELGILGVATFIFFIVRFAQNIKYVKMKYGESGWQPDFVFQMAEAVKIGLIMLFVQGLFGHNLFRDNWYIFASYIVVASNLVNRRLKDELQTHQTISPVPVSETG